MKKNIKTKYEIFENSSQKVIAYKALSGFHRQESELPLSEPILPKSLKPFKPHRKMRTR
jgi:hypothetical protein